MDMACDGGGGGGGGGGLHHCCSVCYVSVYKFRIKKLTVSFHFHVELEGCVSVLHMQSEMWRDSCPAGHFLPLIHQ